MSVPKRQKNSPLQSKSIATGSRSKRVRPIAERRAMPELYVLVPDDSRFSWRRNYRKAHLRNKRGYLYLCWRDGSGVHSHYLGKAPKN